MIRNTFATIAVLLMSAVAIAQVATGPQPFASFGGGPFDSVDLGSLNVNFSVPITQKVGRGAPFFYILSYNNSIWFPTTVNGVMTWQPTSTNYGWQSQNNAGMFGYLSHSAAHARCTPTGFSTSFTNYVYHDPLGATHPLVGASFSIDCGGGSSATDGTTQDGTGLTLHL